MTITVNHLKVLAAVLARAPASLAESMVCGEILEWMAQQVKQQAEAPKEPSKEEPPTDESQPSGVEPGTQEQADEEPHTDSAAGAHPE